jgi:AcrR family transcriptional regulator
MKKTAITPTQDRGDASRQRLIEAGLKIFGQYGFEGASTRRLAAEAEVNIASIPYYFGGKEGLYDAVIDYIIYYCKNRLGTSLESIDKELSREDITQEECRALFTQFIQEMLKLIVGGRKESINISHIIIREQLDPTPAFAKLFESTFRHMHATLCRLIVKLTGIDPNHGHLKLITQAIIGQVATFKSSRETVLRNMGWSGFGEEEIAAIANVVEAHTTAIIEAYRNKKI